jgi:hypothetical protein
MFRASVYRYSIEVLPTHDNSTTQHGYVYQYAKKRFSIIGFVYSAFYEITLFRHAYIEGSDLYLYERYVTIPAKPG